MRLLFIFSFIILGLLPVVGQHQVTIERDIAIYNEAFINRDYDKQISYSIKSVIQIGGGEELMRDVATEQAANMMVNKTKIVSLIPVWYSTVYESEGAKHVVVGQQEIMSIKDRNYERTTYYLAESIDLDKSWCFIPLEGYDAEAIQLYVPGLSADLVVPTPSAILEIRE